jgi:hypothetical protein
MIPGCERKYTNSTRVAHHINTNHTDLSKEEKEKYEKIRKNMKPT